MSFYTASKLKLKVQRKGLSSAPMMPSKSVVMMLICESHTKTSRMVSDICFKNRPRSREKPHEKPTSPHSIIFAFIWERYSPKTANA